jgi:hypothetical protein
MTAPATLPQLADVDQLRAWPGVDVPTEQEAAANAVLARASSVVRRQAGKTWVDTDGALSGVPPEIPGIVVETAARFWNNPHGASMVVRGPFTEAFSQALEAGVFLTQTQKDDIAAAVSARKSKLWTLGTTRDHEDGDPVYVSDQYGGDSILYYEWGQGL